MYNAHLFSADFRIGIAIIDGRFNEIVNERTARQLGATTLRTATGGGECLMHRDDGIMKFVLEMTLKF